MTPYTAMAIAHLHMWARLARAGYCPAPGPEHYAAAGVEPQTIERLSELLAEINEELQ